MAVIVTNRKTGKNVTLLNPSEKGAKFAKELKTNVARKNDGVIKFNKKTGTVQTLSQEQRAFRAGYLASRKDSARAYKAKRKKAV